MDAKNPKKLTLPNGLFDRIILAIRQEQEFKNTKKLLFLFLGLLIISVVSAPMSWTVLVEQIEDSGILYFISMAVSDLDSFVDFWQDFGLAIIGSLPILGIIIFAINIVLLLFTVRLFLYKKQFLFRYLTHNLKLTN